MVGKLFDLKMKNKETRVPGNIKLPFLAFKTVAYVCLLGDFVRILPCESSPFFTTMWGIFLDFFRHHGQADLRSLTSAPQKTNGWNLRIVHRV